jgi:hypothetical protein
MFMFYVLDASLLMKSLRTLYSPGPGVFSLWFLEPLADVPKNTLREDVDSDLLSVFTSYSPGPGIFATLSFGLGCKLKRTLAVLSSRKDFYAYSPGPGAVIILFYWKRRS